MNYIVPIAVGLLLAVAAGFRAFVPLAAMAWGARLGLMDVGPDLAWLAGDTAVISFTAAVVFEVLADKFPAVDHFFDVIGVVVKPVAGMLVMFIALHDTDPFYVTVISIIAGGGIAGIVHAAKAKGRIIANIFTFGIAAPLLSLVEDLLAMFLVIASAFFPLIAVAGMAIIIIFIVRRVLDRRRHDPSPTSF